MTNEEAVRILRRIQEPEAWEPQINGAAFEALDMAIEALGQKQAAGSGNLISRQAAIDTFYELWGTSLTRTVDAIKQLPSAEPAEPKIIRCKDCENWDTTWTNDFSPNYHYCPMVDGVRKEDWFCADAERKTK